MVLPTKTSMGPHSGLADLLDEIVEMTGGAALACIGPQVVAHAVHRDHCPPDDVVDAVLHRIAGAVIDAAPPEISVLADGDGLHLVLTGKVPRGSASFRTLVRAIWAELAGDRAPSSAVSLSRLVQGIGAESDVDALAMPVSGARLVVALCPDDAAVRRSVATLERDRDVALCALPGRVVVVLTRDVPRRADDDRGMRAAVRVATAVTREHNRCAVGISGRLSDDADLAAAFDDTTSAARLAEGRRQRYVCVDDAWAAITITRLRHSVPAVLTGTNPVAALAAHDAARGTEMSHTVAVWLAHNRDTVAVARQLRLHPNSLRHRIRRAGEISGLDLRDPEQCLVAQLALPQVDRL